jgi:hypothetical protein
MFTTPDGSSYSDVSTFIPTSPVDLQAADTSTGDMQDNGWKFVSGGATGLNVAFTGLTAATCAGYILVTNSFSLGQTCETVPYSGSYRCRALAYSDQHGFILLASDGTDSKLYTSTNGTSWTLRFTLTAHHLTGVSACGDLICMAEMDTAAFGWNENPCGLWYTTSELSYTPHRVPTFVLPHASVSLGNSKFIYPQVTCARDQDGAYQFCAYNTAALALSLTAGRFLR